MTVTDWEEMAVLETHDMWICDVSILIHLVGVVSRYASFRCERELCNDVHNSLFIILLFSFLRPVIFVSCLSSRCTFWHDRNHLLLRIFFIGWLRAWSLVLLALSLIWSTMQSILLNNIIFIRLLVIIAVVRILWTVASLARRSHLLLHLKFGAVKLIRFLWCYIITILLLILLLYSHTSGRWTIFGCFRLLLNTL